MNLSSVFMPFQLISKSKPMPNQKKLILAAFAGLILSSSSLFAADSIIATVNGDTISEDQLKIAAAQSKLKFAELTQEQKKLLSDALVNRQLVLQEAKKAKYDKEVDVVERVKALTDSYIAANYLAQIAKKFKIEDKDIRAYYKTNVLTNTPNEYKARHILVKTEDEANTIIKDINGGADFSKIAKEKSTDTGSAERGGDLGWFSEKDMVAIFSKAVASLNKGEWTKAPVNSQFGWHVIILDDARTTKAPEFDAVKQNIKQLLIKEELNKYLTDLNKKAKITLK